MKNIEEIKKERTKPSRAEPREEKTKRIRQWRSDCLSLIAFLGGGDLFRVRGITVYAFPSPFDSYFTRFSDFSLSLSLCVLFSTPSLICTDLDILKFLPFFFLVRQIRYIVAFFVLKLRSFLGEIKVF